MEELALEPWLDLDRSPIRYRQGSGAAAINLNGIAATEDGCHLLTVQANTGKLFRIEVSTKAVREVDLGGQLLLGGDGLLLIEQTLYVIRDTPDPLLEIRLADDLLSGDVTRLPPGPTLKSPTSAAVCGGYLLIVNSQFPAFFARLPPELPFTLTTVPLPAAVARAS